MIMPLSALLLESVALVGGTVHSLAPGAAAIKATLIVDKDRIVAITSAASIPAGARVIDCSGMHLVPGLIDGMVNLDPDHDRLYLSCGITFVRDVGNDLTQILAERDTYVRDRNPGPALWCAGAVLDGPHPSTTAAIVLGSASEATDKLSRLFDQAPGLVPNFLSVQPGLPVDAWRAAIIVAHKQPHPLQVWGPLAGTSTLDEALAAGQDGIYHLEGLLPKGLGWETCKREDWVPNAERIIKSKLMLTPTLAVYAQRLIAPQKEPHEFAFLGPAYIGWWLAEAELRRRQFEDAGSKELLARAAQGFEQQSAFVKALFEGGATIVPGSASPNPWMFPGEALLNELKLYVRAGIPADKVLRMATVGAANALGCGAERGTLEQDKLADIIVTSEDPEHELGTLHSPELVVLRGRVLDKQLLETLRQGLADAQTKRRDLAFKPLAITDPELPFGDVLLRGMVESRAVGQRIGGESFAVVAAHDGTTAYCGHVLTLGTVSTADTEVFIRQNVKDGDLVAFQATIKSGSRTVEIVGTLAGGMLNIARHVDGAFVDQNSIRERVALADVGSITTELILGQRPTEGDFRAVYFEDFEPAVGVFKLRLDSDGTHLIQAPAGDMTTSYSLDGVPQIARRQTGKSWIETRPQSAQATNGKGLPIPMAMRPKAGAAPRPK